MGEDFYSPQTEPNNTHNCHLIHNNTFKNIKLLHVLDITMKYLLTYYFLTYCFLTYYLLTYCLLSYCLLITYVLINSLIITSLLITYLILTYYLLTYYLLVLTYYLLITFSLTYLLSPWSRVLLEKLTGFQLVKKIPTF